MILSSAASAAPSTQARRRSTARARLIPLAGLVLGAGLVLSACSDGVASDKATAETDPTGSGPAASDSHGEHEGDHTNTVDVGPLALFAADYWSVVEPSEGLTQVRAGGCPEGEACPSFDVLSGDAVTGVDPAQAYVPEGAFCPGTGELTVASSKETSKLDVEIDGQPATLTRFELSCVDASGAEQMTVEQMQWYVPDSPNGPTLIADRWAFEGLEQRLYAATWATASA
ncbi:hypothetical protein [Oerskovia turbata]